ncbi:MAG: hypothetical protein M1831_003056 [Alyxoria varia]|nr:MAG: hypothetical protein M1831_003056 [Alyxoria varia]
MTETVGVIDLVNIVTDKVQTTKRFINNIRGRPEGVDQLSGDLGDMEKSLGDLRTQSNNSSTWNLSIKSETAKTIRPALNACQQASAKVESTLMPFVNSEGPGKYAWKKLGGGISDQKIRELQGQLASCKGSLSMAANAANAPANLLAQAKQTVAQLQK